MRPRVSVRSTAIVLEILHCRAFAAGAPTGAVRRVDLGAAPHPRRSSHRVTTASCFAMAPSTRDLRRPRRCAVVALRSPSPPPDIAPGWRIPVVAATAVSIPTAPREDRRVFSPTGPHADRNNTSKRNIPRRQGRDDRVGAYAPANVAIRIADVPRRRVERRLPRDSRAFALRGHPRGTAPERPASARSHARPSDGKGVFARIAFQPGVGVQPSIWNSRRRCRRTAATAYAVREFRRKRSATPRPAVRRRDEPGNARTRRARAVSPTPPSPAPSPSSSPPFFGRLARRCRSSSTATLDAARSPRAETPPPPRASFRQSPRRRRSSAAARRVSRGTPRLPSWTANPSLSACPRRGTRHRVTRLAAAARPPPSPAAIRPSRARATTPSGTAIVRGLRGVPPRGSADARRFRARDVLDASGPPWTPWTPWGPSPRGPPSSSSSGQIRARRPRLRRGRERRRGGAPRRRGSASPSPSPVREIRRRALVRPRALRATFRSGSASPPPRRRGTRSRVDHLLNRARAGRSARASALISRPGASVRGGAFFQAGFVALKSVWPRPRRVLLDARRQILVAASSVWRNWPTPSAADDAAWGSSPPLAGQRARRQRGFDDDHGESARRFGTPRTPGRSRRPRARAIGRGRPRRGDAGDERAEMAAPAAAVRRHHRRKPGGARAGLVDARSLGPTSGRRRAPAPRRARRAPTSRGKATAEVAPERAALSWKMSVSRARPPRRRWPAA